MTSNRSLRARLTSGLVVIVLMLVVVSITAIVSLTTLGSAVGTTLRENYRSVIACEQMHDALGRIDAASRFESNARSDLASATMATSRAEFARAFEVEAHNITLPGEREAVHEIDRHYRAYIGSIDAAAGSPGRDAYMHEILPRYGRVEEAVRRVERMNHASMVSADREAKRVARRSMTLTVGVCLVAIVVALAYLWRLPRGLVAPLQRFASAARAIGQGDLEVNVPDPGMRELDDLYDSFRRMVVRLRTYRESSLGELLAAQDLANSTVQCLLDPVVVIEGDGDILLTNAAAENAFGLRAGSAAELRDADVRIPIEFLQARDRTLRDGTVAAPRSLADAMAWSDPSRGERFYLVRATTLRHEGAGDSSRCLVVAQDVTRLRRIDALKSDMVATVSHEFKTPLTSLRMATHLLLEASTGPLSDAQREVVTTARDDTERLRSLVDELLDLVRIETEAGELHLVPVDPRALLQRVVDGQRTVAREKRVTLTIAEDTAASKALGDPEKLAIVLANLVSNAVRHTPRESTVTLRAHDDGDSVRFTVRDEGEGLSPAVASALFERGTNVRRATRPSGRHGLGLIIAHEIVLQHSGELGVRSGPGRGSEFTMVLPKAPTK